jgi:hypothetical protein
LLFKRQKQTAQLPVPTASSRDATSSPSELGRQLVCPLRAAATCNRVDAAWRGAISTTRWLSNGFPSSAQNYRWCGPVGARTGSVASPRGFARPGARKGSSISSDLSHHQRAMPPSLPCRHAARQLVAGWPEATAVHQSLRYGAIPQSIRAAMLRLDAQREDKAMFSATRSIVMWSGPAPARCASTSTSHGWRFQAPPGCAAADLPQPDAPTRVTNSLLCDVQVDLLQRGGGAGSASRPLRWH